MTDFDPSNIQLSERQAECLRFIEQEYTLHGQVPTGELISERLMIPPSTVKRWLGSQTFEALLRGKGIELKPTNGVLTAKQLVLVNMLLNISDPRSEREKLEEAQVSPQTYSAWRRDPAFMDFMHRRAEALFNDSSDIAYMSVVKGMRRGDHNSTKLYMEMTGKYQPAGSKTVDLEKFVQGFIEILAYRVSDPALLDTIADDIQNLLEGKPFAAAVERPPMAAIPAASTELLGGIVDGQPERQVAPVLPAGGERPAPSMTPNKFDIKLDLRG